MTLSPSSISPTPRVLGLSAPGRSKYTPRRRDTRWSQRSLERALDASSPYLREDRGEGGALLRGAHGDADTAVERRRAGHAHEDAARRQFLDQRASALRPAHVDGHEVG